jgi:hypothetical protein
MVATYALRGKVSDGLFSTEKIVTFLDAVGNDISVVASDRHVLSPGALIVRILGRQGDQLVVELPGDVYGAGRTVLVSESDVHEVK